MQQSAGRRRKMSPPYLTRDEGHNNEALAVFTE